MYLWHVSSTSICLNNKVILLLPHLPSLGCQQLQDVVHIRIQSQVPSLPLSALIFKRASSVRAFHPARLTFLRRPGLPGLGFLPPPSHQDPTLECLPPSWFRALSICEAFSSLAGDGERSPLLAPVSWAQFLATCAWLSTRIEILLPFWVFILHHVCHPFSEV